MSEKNQEDRVEQEDLIGQIIAQGLDRMKAPVRTEDAPEPETPPAPKQEDAGEAASPAASKNRRSAAYLYLLILFGAAFLLLLLAYFIQQRNSEDTISVLRETMNLSRAELLAEIQELEDRNTALENQNTTLNERINRLNDELAQWRDRYDEKELEYAQLWDQNYDALEETYAWTSFWALERYYLAGDYESCAALLVLEPMRQYNALPAYEGVSERHEEIVRAVVDRGILDEDYLAHIPDYEALLDAYFDRLGVLTESAPQP